MLKNLIHSRYISFVLVVMMIVSVSLIHPVFTSADSSSKTYTYQVYDNFNVPKRSFTSNRRYDNYKLRVNGSWKTGLSHIIAVQNSEDVDTVKVTYGEEYSDDVYSGKVLKVDVTESSSGTNKRSLVVNPFFDGFTNVSAYGRDTILIKGSYKPLSERNNFGIYGSFENQNDGTHKWGYILRFQDGAWYAGESNSFPVPFDVSDSGWYNVSATIVHKTNSILFNINGKCSSFSFKDVLSNVVISDGYRAKAVRPTYCCGIAGYNNSFICSNYSVQDIPLTDSYIYKSLTNDELNYNVYGSLFNTGVYTYYQDEPVCIGAYGKTISELSQEDDFYKIIVVPNGSTEPIEDSSHVLKSGDKIYFYSLDNTPYIVRDFTLCYRGDFEFNEVFSETELYGEITVIDPFGKLSGDKLVFTVLSEDGTLKYSTVQSISKYGVRNGVVFSLAEYENIGILSTDTINIHILKNDFITPSSGEYTCTPSI